MNRFILSFCRSLIIITILSGIHMGVLRDDNLENVYDSTPSKDMDQTGNNTPKIIDFMNSVIMVS